MKPPNTEPPINDMDIVIAGLLDAVKYLIRGDTYTAEQKLKSAEATFRRTRLGDGR